MLLKTRFVLFFFLGDQNLPCFFFSNIIKKKNIHKDVNNILWFSMNPVLYSSFFGLFSEPQRKNLSHNYSNLDYSYVKKSLNLQKKPTMSFSFAVGFFLGVFNYFLK